MKQRFNTSHNDQPRLNRIDEILGYLEGCGIILYVLNKPKYSYVGVLIKRTNS
jgi:hypothetical protein